MLVPVCIIVAVLAAAVFGYLIGPLRQPTPPRPVPAGTIRINRSGWKTPSPQVHVSACSRRGAQSVYSWPADDVGEAKATMYGKTLAEILGLPLVDERSPENAPDPQPLAAALQPYVSRHFHDSQSMLRDHIRRDDEIYGRNG
jgi:hypothetical protein